MIFFEIVKGWFSSSATPVDVAPNDATQSQTIQPATIVRISLEAPRHTLRDEMAQNTLFDDMPQNTAFDELNKPTLFEV